ncbi:glycoside hydrolase family 65 protein [Apiospora hydei]|uniref:alpha,alpha-trehalase n=1 Tax=Apiospora hydei TaxID=1337664 RepID=A0ABR1XBH1_9PEZI
MTRLLAPLLTASAVVSATPLNLPANWVSWDDATWTLKSTVPLPGTFAAWAPQSNGYIGVAQGSLGPFFELSRYNDSEGWPSYSKPRRTFATTSGFWGSEPSTDELDPRGESFISGLPHFTDLLVEACGDLLHGSTDLAEISDFVSELSFKEGIATWSYLWQPPSCMNNRTISIKYESFLSLATRQLAAVKLSLASDSGLDDVRIIDKLDGRSALRTTPARTNYVPGASEVVSAVSPTGVNSTTAYILSTIDGDLQYNDTLATHDGSNLSAYTHLFSMAFLKDTTNSTSSKIYAIRPGSKSAEIRKYVGVASSDHFGDAAEVVAVNVAKKARVQGYDAARADHRQEVSRLMDNHVVADFRDPVTGEMPEDHLIQTLQITAISSAYYLYTNLLPWDSEVDSHPERCVACNSLPVGGLSSQAYGGKIFWDAEMFMAPPTQGTHPRLARQFAQYRINRASEAKKNTERHALKAGSMLYPWTGGRYGQCYNQTGPCIMYQYHLNADIALSLLMGKNTSGDGIWFEKSGAVDAIDGVATGLSETLAFRDDTKTWGIDIMTDADEYYMYVADGSFTSSAISVILEAASNLRRQSGIPVDDKWVKQLESMAIPTSDDGVVLEFRNMPNSIISKQADVILSHYPFDYRRNFSTEKRRLAMDYYSVRQDPNGPAMTWGLYAIAANTLTDSGCAFWTFLVKSFQPYVRAPWYQFSEQQVDRPSVKDPLTGQDINPAFPFLTGHGGLLQTFTAGFLGLKVTDTNLVVLPSLPPQLHHFKAPIQFYNGAVVEFWMNQTHTNITRHDASLFDGLVPDQYGAADMPITIGRNVNDGDSYTIHLAINGTATIKNRAQHTSLNMAGNILQCLDAKTEDAYAPGQFPFAAADGYAGTVWQPTGSNSASLTIETTSLSPTRLKSVHLDFGMRPPKSVRVLLSNSSTFDDPKTTQEIVRETKIQITQPWKPDSPVVPYAGNITEIALADEVWSGKYARLQIEGCWVEDGVDATVAEFALLAAD